MKRLLLFFFCLRFCLCVAQPDQPRRHFVAASFGLCFPKGNYRLLDARNGYAGLAKEGYTFGIEGVYYQNTHLGWGGKVLSYANQVDEEALSSSLVTHLKATLPGYSSVYLTGTTPYHHIFAGAGLYLSFPVSKGTFDLHCIPGFLHSRLYGYQNEIRMVQYEKEYVFRNTLQGGTATSLALNLGTSARIEVSKRISVKVNLDYYYGRQKTAFYQTSTLDKYTVSLVPTGKLSVKTFQVTAGIAVNLYKPATDAP